MQLSLRLWREEPNREWLWLFFSTNRKIKWIKSTKHNGYGTFERGSIPTVLNGLYRFASVASEMSSSIWKLRVLASTSTKFTNAAFLYRFFHYFRSAVFSSLRVWESRNATSYYDSCMYKRKLTDTTIKSGFSWDLTVPRVLPVWERLIECSSRQSTYIKRKPFLWRASSKIQGFQNKLATTGVPTVKLHRDSSPATFCLHIKIISIKPI